MTKNKKLCEYNLAFVDCETTGLDPIFQEIIEIAAIIYNPKKQKIIKKWFKKAAPRNLKVASKIALEINGYNEAPETYKEDIKNVMLEFHKIIKNCIIVGQNIQFDINFINKYYKEFSIDDEIHRHRKLEISSIVWPLCNSNLSDISLKSICDYFNISNENSHRALVDCERTLEVYRCAMSIYQESTKNI